MKTSLFYFQTIVASLLFAFYPNISNSQTPCFNCLSNGNSANDFAFATGKDNSANGISSFSAGYLNSSFGEYSFAIGYENNASGYASISIGRLSESYGNYSLALGAECRTNTLSYAFGQNAQAIAHQSMAIGRNVKSSASNAITIGCSSSTEILNNSIDNSLIVGFNSTQPILYVGKPIGETYGKVGIGTVEPTEKLNIKGGNIYLEDIDAGVIMRSPDGNCWKITVGNDGQLNTEAYNCYTDIPESPGTDDLSLIKVYPNPSKGELVVELNQTDLQNLNLQILDASGKLVSSKAINRSTNSIDISSLKSGLYLIRVSGKGKEVLFTHKFLKE